MNLSLPTIMAVNPSAFSSFMSAPGRASSSTVALRPIAAFLPSVLAHNKKSGTCYRSIYLWNKASQSPTSLSPAYLSSSTAGGRLPAVVVWAVITACPVPSCVPWLAIAVGHHSNHCRFRVRWQVYGFAAWPYGPHVSQTCSHAAPRLCHRWNAPSIGFVSFCGQRRGSDICTKERGERGPRT